jgi:integrase
VATKTDNRTGITRAFLEAHTGPRDRPYRIHDAKVHGLHLRVQPSGVRTWYVQYQRNAATPIGRYPAVPLDAARSRALVVLAEAAQHGEPAKVRERRQAGERRRGERVETFGELVQHYEGFAQHEHKPGSLAKTLHRLRVVFAGWQDKPLRALDAFTIERFKRDRLKDGKAPATVARDLDTLRAVLSHAVRAGFIAGHPMPADKVRRLKFDNERVRFLSDDEETRLRGALALRDHEGRQARAAFNRWRESRRRELLPAIPDNGFADHLTPLVLTALGTGLRRGELTALTWGDVDFAHGLATVRAAAAKGGKRRDVPMNAEVADLLRRWRRQCAGDRVFPLADPKTAWGRLLDKAAIQGFTFHDLRHTFASRLVQRGVPLNTVRELLGHGDLKMTLRYARLAPADKAAAVALLAGPPVAGRGR